MANLITLEDYKIYMSINSATQDDRHNGIIERVSDMVRIYCGREFITSGPLTEYFKGIYDEVYVSEGIIDTIISVEVVSELDPVTGAPIYETWVENDNTNGTGYWVDKDEGKITTMHGGTFYLGRPFAQAVRVIYDTGISSLTQISPSLQQAVMDTVKLYDKHETTTRISNMNQSVDNSFTPPQLARDFPPHIKRVLDLHRQVVTLGG